MICLKLWQFDLSMWFTFFWPNFIEIWPKLCTLHYQHISEPVPFFITQSLLNHSVEISWIFYHSVFTWNQVYEFWKYKISHPNTCNGSEMLLFILFCTFWRQKITKLTKFRTRKKAKMAVLELLDSPKLNSLKSEWQKNTEISTLCYLDFIRMRFQRFNKVVIATVLITFKSQNLSITNNNFFHLW